MNLRYFDGQKDKGFSFVELIVVIAIMAILSVVLVPVFTKELEKSRETQDVNNVRNAYDAIMAAVADHDKTAVFNGATIYSSGFFEIDVPLCQLKEGWSLGSDKLNIAGITPANTLQWIGEPKIGGSCKVSYIDGIIRINWQGEGGAAGPVLSHVNADVKDAFAAMNSAKKGSAFVVANSTCPGQGPSTTISTINKALSDSGSDIKTWAVISTERYNTNASLKEEKLNYLFSEVDISNSSEWSVGDQIPAIMQRQDKVYVGMATIREGGDRTQNYYVISKDENGQAANVGGNVNPNYQINTVLSNAKEFSSLDEAYAYYKTLEVIRK